MLIDLQLAFLHHTIVTTIPRASRALLLACALALSVIFIYYSCDLTARMTSAPQKISVNSFQDVKDQDFDIIYFGRGLVGAHYLKTGNEVMQWLYKNKIEGNEDDLGYTSFAPMVKRAVEEPKTLLYWVYHPYTQDAMEKKLVALDIQEKINIPEGHLVQKNSEFRAVISHQVSKMKESGLIDQLSDKWWRFALRQTQNDKKSKNDEAISLGFENVTLPFAFVAIGMIGAQVVIMGEFCMKKVGVNMDINGSSAASLRSDRKLGMY